MQVKVRSVTRRTHAATSLRRAKRSLLGAIVAVSASGAVASTVLACSSIMGSLTLTPPSGRPGTVVMTSATGLKAYPAKYQLRFGGDCMMFNGTLLKTITTNRIGGWSNVAVSIPSSASPGTYALCGVEVYPVRAGTATTHNTWTVT